MADNDNEVQYTKPTTTVAYEAWLEEEEKRNDPKAREDEVNERFAASAASPFTVKGTENTENEESFVGVDPIYANYADVTHQPFDSEDGVEKELEERARKSLDERTENSKQATTGFTNYGPSVEHDPLGRSAPIVRGGSGDQEADRAAVAASASGPTETPAPAKGAAKRSAAAPE